MHPQIDFDIFGQHFVYSSYALFTWIGAITGIVTALPFLKREGLKIRQSLPLLLIMALGFLVGARVFNFFINPEAYGGNLHIYTLRLKGLAVYGGIFGSFLILLAYSFFKKKSVLPLLDALVLPAGLAFALARVGCFLNGCCAGTATKSPLGVSFPLNEVEQEIIDSIYSLVGLSSATLRQYPTQLFELALALVGLVPVMWLYFKKRLPVGGAFLIYGIWFSCMRLFILPFRALPYKDFVTKVFYPIFYVSLIFVGAALLISVYKQKNIRQKNERKTE